MAPRRRPALWPTLTALAAAVVVGSVALWVDRAASLRTGLPCEGRGWLGCVVDGPVYFALGIIGGGLITLVSGALAAFTRPRSPTAARVLLGMGALSWLVLFGLLLSGA